MPADPCRTLGGSKKYKKSPSLRLDNMPDRAQMQKNGTYYRSGYLTTFNRQAHRASTPNTSPRTNKWAMAFFGLIGDDPLPDEGSFKINPKGVFVICFDGVEVCSFLDTVPAWNAFYELKRYSRQTVTFLFHTRG